MIIKISVNKSLLFRSESQSRLNGKAMKIPLLCIVFAVFISLTAPQSAPTCGEPHEIEFASVTTKTPEKSLVGTTITYACQFGFVIDGTSRTSRCDPTRDPEKAEWSKPQMSCIPRSCGDPGFVSNGQRIGSLFTFSNSVTFQCDEGFRLIGKATRYCHASGSWSGTLPRCEGISCDIPNDPEHGQVIYTSLEFGSELKFKCDTGYRLTKQEPVICTHDGTWSRSESICVEAACDIPQAPEHGTVRLTGSNGNPLAGTVAVFSCDDNRIADGPTASKCLDIGEWTFPAPNCLEPCKIPAVPNGKIGRYVKRTRNHNSVFSEIPVGTGIEDNEKLFLHCANPYRPLGSSNWQEKVTCSDGKWLDDPFCDLPTCSSDPPPVQNARAEKINNKHLGTVFYRCSNYFTKAKSGNITCDLGEWKGYVPICKDSRCYTDALEFQEVEYGGKTIYSSGENLQVVCNRRYSHAAHHSGYIKCKDGVWESDSPPCVAGSCSDSPPNIAYGRPQLDSTAHGSVVKYICEHPYVLIGYSTVKCQFGEWTGQTPKCENSRCLLEDLKFNTGVSPDTQKTTNSGDRLNVRCIEGYTQRYPLPTCLTGTWSWITKSPCKERECVVQWIPGASIKEQKVGQGAWNWRTLSYAKKVTFENVVYGTVAKRGMDLFLFCNSGYNFQGTGYVRSSIHCSEGKWSPDPICVLNGNTYVSSTKAVLVTSEINRNTDSLPRTTSQTSILRTTAPSSTVSTTSILNEKIDIKVETTFNPNPAEEAMEENICVCVYTLKDDYVFAYAHDKELKFSDSVEDGSVVNFRCKDVGLHNLVGKKQIKCENCHTWHSSEFPTCHNPKSGDAVIIYDTNVTISLDGALEVRKGRSVRLTCVAMEEAEFPVWKCPSERGMRVVNDTLERSTGDVLYMAHLEISNPDQENDGLYECTVGTNFPTVVELRVIDPNMRCSKFEDEENFIITYEMDTYVGSQATFYCRKPDWILNGTNVLTCLRNGEWSSNAPECTEKRCRKLEETDLMVISYTDDRKIRSFVNFHCFAPGERLGVARTECLENGQWANTIPTCKKPACTSVSLFSALPQGTEVNMDDITNGTLPFNSIVRLTCKSDLIPVGNPVAKCVADRKWELDTVRCESGCLPFTESSENKVITKPRKDSYNFGEFLELSCPPGLYLNRELHKIVCLRTGWSEKNLPECTDSNLFGLDYS